ncbi:43778_t:CDS:2 [Gigaspora margarita]|uniref:43778_t:CDS:1 n=1 Tax=Gigaspora margarita TaxID=4874 RepID=A0ABN7URI2_GIGMA|nr:43778_t:CDS:2 [Gigaspora margarita]
MSRVQQKLIVGYEVLGIQMPEIMYGEHEENIYHRLGIAVRLGEGINYTEISQKLVLGMA